MKPITEERRQQLIALARIEISRWKLPADKQYMVYLMEIALASLTAEPTAYLWDTYTGLRYASKALQGKDCRALYTVPPVPVIKFPDDDFELGEAHGVQRRFDFSNGANFAISEIKRLNGLGE